MRSDEVEAVRKVITHRVIFRNKMKERLRDKWRREGFYLPWDHRLSEDGDHFIVEYIRMDIEKELDINIRPDDFDEGTTIRGAANVVIGILEQDGSFSNCYDEKGDFKKLPKKIKIEIEQKEINKKPFGIDWI
jgi:hypothetical protein